MIKKPFNTFLALVISIFFLLPYISLRQIDRDREIHRNQYIAAQKLNNISLKLIEEINKTLEYVDVLDIIVKNNPNDMDIIKNYAEMILSKHDILQNIAIAPNGIVQYIYPTTSNEIVIGHDLLKDPERFPFIKKAIEEKTKVIQGPVKAIQGGVLIFNRKAIFIPYENTEKFWGVCVVTIDFEKLISNSGIDEDNEDYFIALKVLKTDGFKDFIWGSPDILLKETLVNTITVQDQEWKVFIYPRYGWTNTQNKWFGLEAIDGFFIFICYVLYRFVLWHLNRYTEASKIDSMTGTLNKSIFKKYVIRNLKKKKGLQSILVIDINNFKLINDNYGHLAGDYVICELANRLMTLSTKSNLLSRWGGDEFIIYWSNLSQKEDIESVIDRIYTEVAKPFYINHECIKLNIAIGYAIYPEDGLDFETLYHKADTMMYENKDSMKQEKSFNK